MNLSTIKRVGVSLAVALALIACSSATSEKVATQEQTNESGLPDPFEVVGCEGEGGLAQWSEAWDAPSQFQVGYPDFQSLIDGLGSLHWERVGDGSLPLRTGDVIGEPSGLADSVSVESVEALPTGSFPTPGGAVDGGVRYVSTRRALEYAGTELEGGADLYVGLSTPGRVSGDVELTFVSVRPDGDVIGLDECWSVTRALMEVEEPDTAFEQLRTGRDEAALTALRQAWSNAPVGPSPLPPWEERAPSDRNLTDAPPEIMKQLVPTTVAVLVPDQWKADGYRLCTQVSLGNGPCIDLGRGRAVTQSDGYIRFTALALPSEDLQITLTTRPGAGEAQERHLLALVPFSLAERGVRLTPTPESSALMPDRLLEYDGEVFAFEPDTSAPPTELPSCDEAVDTSSTGCEFTVNDGD